MMNFSSVTAVTIPEGTVKKIRDAAGNTIWQKAEDTTTVTVLLENSIQQPYQKVIVNGITLTQAGQSASVTPGTIIQLQGQFGAWELIDPENNITAQVCTFADTQTPADYAVQHGILIRFDNNGLLIIKPLN